MTTTGSIQGIQYQEVDGNDTYLPVSKDEADFFVVRIENIQDEYYSEEDFLTYDDAESHLRSHGITTFDGSA
jgi:hypothetical protein